MGQNLWHLVKTNGQMSWSKSMVGKSVKQSDSQSVKKFGMIITGQIGWFGWVVVVEQN